MPISRTLTNYNVLTEHVIVTTYCIGLLHIKITVHSWNLFQNAHSFCLQLSCVGQ